MQDQNQPMPEQAADFSTFLNRHAQFFLQRKCVFFQPPARVTS
jgi:hypothetical protein